MSILYAGFGRGEISPDTVVPLNSVRRSGDVMEPLYASCTALSDETTRIFIFSVDTRGVTDGLVRRVRSLLKAELGIEEESVFLVATHTHSAPDVSFEGTEPIESWIRNIALPAFLAAAKEALEDLSPCQVQGGTAKTRGVNFVRRYFRADGAFHGLHIVETSDAPVDRHESEADPEVRVLRFVREDKREILLVNWQNHAAEAAITHKGKICADFIGPMRDRLEEGGKAFAMYLQGACGNINSLTEVPAEQHEPGVTVSGYVRIGQELARAVEEAVASAQDLKTGEIRLSTQYLTGIVNHSKSHMAPLVSKVWDAEPADRMRVAQELGFASRYEASAVARRAKMGETAEIPLMAVAMGDFGLTFNPFEMFDVNCVEVREASPFALTFTVGYTGGNFGYLPSAFGFLNGGYETLQCNYMPGTGEQIATKLVRMLKKLQ